MINTIIFDIGNVLIKYIEADNLPGREENREELTMIGDAIYRSGLWDELDRGVVPEEELIGQMRALVPGHEPAFDRVMADIGQSFFKADYARPWLKDLKNRGYRLLFLSNYSRFSMLANWSVLDFLPLLEAGIFSCDVGLIKPDPAIFRLLIDRYYLVPEECVFVDDNANNIAAANGLGFHTVRFSDYESGSAELDKLLELKDD